MRSIWETAIVREERPRLEGELRTDVLVIGAGLAGVLCAHRLQAAGVDCVVLEANSVASGVSASTTAKISAGHGLLYADIAERYGSECAALYYRAQKSAQRAYRTLAQRIPCDFEERDAFVYVQKDARALEREQRTLQAIGADTELVHDLPLPHPTVGAIRYPNEAQLHPLRFLLSLARPLRIFERSRVLSLSDGRAVTRHGAVSAKSIVVATHFPFLNKHGSYFLKQYQYRSYVLALRGAPDLGGMYVDGMGKAPSFRQYGDLLLLGGGGHRTGKQGGEWRFLSDFAMEHYPDARAVARFATQDCMTLDRIPYVGQYSKHTPRLFVATGFNKWGMTNAMVAATLLEDLILERDNPYRSLLDPSRSILHPQLGINAFESVTGLLFPTSRRCPHLGCALKWNNAEHSWDCPCHGSRFDDEGHLLDNPANGDLPR